MERFYRPLSILLFFISIALILEGANITGAVIGHSLSPTITSVIGLFLLVFSLLLMTIKKEERELEERIEEHH